MSFRARHTTNGDEERERLYSTPEGDNENSYDPLAQSQMSLARSHVSGLSRSLTLPPPRDPHTRKPIQVVFIVLGACFLLPWNGLITAMPYFLSRLADSPVRAAFSSYLCVSFQVVNFLMLIYVTATAATASKTHRIRASSMGLTVLFLILTLSTVSNATGMAYFWFVMTIGTLLAVGASVLNTTVVALAALFGPGAMQACFAGQGAVGVIVSAVQLLGALFSSARSGPDDDSHESQAGPAAVFFGLSTVFVMFGLIFHSALLKTPEYTEVVQKWESGKVLLVEEPDQPEYRDEDNLAQDREDREIMSPVEELGVEVPQAKGRVNIWEVAKINSSYNLAVWFCFTVTLAVFPPVTAYVAPVSPNGSLTPTLFTVLHFFVFNAADYLGRASCAYPAVRIWGRRQLATYSLARVAFIPILLMCNIRTPTGELIGISLGGNTPLINSDFAFFALVALLGLTNGHCCSLCMMAASSTEHNGRIRTEQVDTAAAVAQFSLTAGLMSGSMASFAVRRMVCACNPFLS
ncbi:Nucleoside transporter [Ceratobasidium sp. AG-Ba]|nr:Nucleoside transporter [Ceratobasidium sp. AG-Ba]